MKILFSYFGQPRMIRECIPWHDDLIKYIKSLNHEVDLEYHLWETYTNRISKKIYTDNPQELELKRKASKLELYSPEQKKIISKLKHLREKNFKIDNPDNFFKINVDETKEYICSNRVKGCNINCYFYSYDIVEELWQMCESTRDFDRTGFYINFGQIISRALAAKNASEEYDIVIFLRPDLIFNPERYEEFFKAVESQYERDINSKDLRIHVAWLRYFEGIGLRAEDKLSFGTPKAVKKFYDRYKEKIYSFMINSRCMEGHYISCNFGLFYKEQKKLLGINEKDFAEFFKFEGVVMTETKLGKNYATIARSTPEIIKVIKKVNLDSYNKVHEIRTKHDRM